jgi:NAD(P)-dependent dehydrogenase (short-subunit alcohol dehydrogenase family)
MPDRPEQPRSVTGRMPAAGRLAGRRVLVVGGGGRSGADPSAPVGNGQAISILAAREQARVAVADRDASAAAATVGDVAAEGGTAATVIADVAEPEQCERVVAEATGALDGLDGVVLNVGTGEGLGLEGSTAESWDRVLAVNLRAHFLVAKFALPVMDRGAIVFVGSLAGLRPGSNSPSYDASKAALLGLSRHVALEGARRGVRANVVAPGLIDTAMGRAASAARPEREQARIPLRRQGSAWEVGYATTFLLSDEASYVTGQTLVVDGGLGAL